MTSKTKPNTAAGVRGVFSARDGTRWTVYRAIRMNARRLPVSWQTPPRKESEWTAP